MASYYFHADPHDPTLHSKGTDPAHAGKYFIKIVAPDSYLEYDRIYCEVTFQPSGGTEIAIATGEVGVPFTGVSITKNNLAAGTYTFLAKAEYENSDQVQGPYGLTVTVP